MATGKKCITYQGSCEGLQEKLYFKHFQELINNDKSLNKKVNFKIHNNKGGTPLDIVEDARKKSIEEYKNKIAMFDCDFKYDSFKQAILLCKKIKIQPIYSIMNFNLFLILHKKDYSKIINSQDNYEKDLKKVFNLNDVDDIKNEESINKILKQISMNDIKLAIKRAYKLCKNTKSIGKIIIDDIFDQPFLNVHEFMDDILNKVK